MTMTYITTTMTLTTTTMTTSTTTIKQQRKGDASLFARTCSEVATQTYVESLKFYQYLSSSFLQLRYKEIMYPSCTINFKAEEGISILAGVPLTSLHYLFLNNLFISKDLLHMHIQNFINLIAYINNCSTWFFFIIMYAELLHTRL